MCSRFHLLRESARGFSLIELMIVVGFAIVMMAISRSHPHGHLADDEAQ